MEMTIGKYKVLVDVDAYEGLQELTWEIATKRGVPYAVSREYRPEKTSRTYLHRLLLGVTEPNQYVDHINGDTLDNRKVNLRICTNRQNLCNRGKTKANKSGYKGVYKVTAGNKWYAQINSEPYKRITIGIFETKEEAAKAYNEAAVKYFGTFARLNELEGAIK